jgi:hypothetical protein
MEPRKPARGMTEPTFRHNGQQPESFLIAQVKKAYRPTQAAKGRRGMNNGVVATVAPVFQKARLPRRPHLGA